MSTSEIVCSRCGTPFPQEKGKPSVTCVVCGQLRPDLDMTLDDDEEVADVFGAGAGVSTSSSSSSSASAIDTPARAAVAPTPLPKSRVVTPAAQIPAAPPPPAVDRPYVSMSEDIGGRSGMDRVRDSLSERIGPVLLVAAPLAAGMAGALKMLSMVDDFSAGAWYAVGTLFLALLIGSWLAGLIASSIFFVLRLRWSFLLRVLFLGAAAAVAYFGVREVPSHVQVRENALPGILIGR